MLIGFMFARRKMFEPHHKFIMTGIVLFNWVLIIVIMAVSYSDSVAPNVGDDLSDRFYLIPTIHLLFGITAQLLGTYLVIRMWFEDQLPDWFKVKRIKRYMRLTLALWLATALLGALIYFVWYVDDTAEAADTLPGGPVATEEATDGVQPPAATEEAEDDDDQDENEDEEEEAGEDD
jgi:uncharacterized membrane protein YozB (DUF420 family)